MTARKRINIGNKSRFGTNIISKKDHRAQYRPSRIPRHLASEGYLRPDQAAKAVFFEFIDDFKKPTIRNVRKVGSGKWISGKMPEAYSPHQALLHISHLERRSFKESGSTYVHKTVIETAA